MGMETLGLNKAVGGWHESSTWKVKVEDPERSLNNSVTQDNANPCLSKFPGPLTVGN